MHELGIIHRDLKPQNILIIVKGKFLSAKLSDMGISKRLLGDMSSLTHHGTGEYLISVVLLMFFNTWMHTGRVVQITTKQLQGGKFLS